MSAYLSQVYSSQHQTVLSSAPSIRLIIEFAVVWSQESNHRFQIVKIGLFEMNLLCPINCYLLESLPWVLTFSLHVWFHKEGTMHFLIEDGDLLSVGRGECLTLGWGWGSTAVCGQEGRLLTVICGIPSIFRMIFLKRTLPHLCLAEKPEKHFP